MNVRQLKAILSTLPDDDEVTIGGDNYASAVAGASKAVLVDGRIVIALYPGQEAHEIAYEQPYEGSLT